MAVSLVWASYRVSKNEEEKKSWSVLLKEGRLPPICLSQVIDRNNTVFLLP